MTASTTVHTSERNGYRITVYAYTVKGAKRFGSRVTNLTTGNSEQTPGWSSRSVALEVAQEAADKAQI